MTTLSPWRTILLTGAAGLVLPPSTVAAQAPLDAGWEGVSIETLAQPDPASPCITPREQAEVEALIAATRHLWAPPQGAGWTAAAPPFAFFPQGAAWMEDIGPSALFDHDPGPGLLDDQCGTHTYDGHNAIDSALRSFGEQVVGVPVFAAADGVVVSTDDGHPDMNTQALGQPANFVLLEHAGGLQTWNWHLANGSVSVAPGQTVVAGQQIGLTASSGSSTGPHLHFAVNDNGTWVDPFAGPCNAEPGLWVDQLPYPGAQWIHDHAFAREDPTLHPWPMEQPRTGLFAFTDVTKYEWFLVRDLPPDSTFQRRYVRPDGTTAFTGSGSFGNPEPMSQKLTFWFNITGMASIPGTWRVETTINGQVVSDAPMEIAPVFDPAFNRAPEPITATFEPAGPTDVLRCAVGGDPLLDDLDYDLLRYRYEWTVDGVGVRDVVTAGRADLLPAVPLGGLVRCTVTASDGTDDGDPAVATVPVQGPAFADLGDALAGTHGPPILVGVGTLEGGSTMRLVLAEARENALAYLVLSAGTLGLPFKGGTLVPDPTPPAGLFVAVPTDAAGGLVLDLPFPAGLPSGVALYEQYWIVDPAGPVGFAASNSVVGTTP